MKAKWITSENNWERHECGCIKLYEGDDPEAPVDKHQVHVWRPGDGWWTIQCIDHQMATLCGLD